MSTTIQGTHLTLTYGIRRLGEEKLADAFRSLRGIALDPVQVRVELEHRAGHHDEAAAVQPFSPLSLRAISDTTVHREEGRVHTDTAAPGGRAPALRALVWAVALGVTVALGGCSPTGSVLLGGGARAVVETIKDARPGSADESAYGFIDRSGGWVIEPTLHFASDFSEGFAGACITEGRCGFIDTSGRFVVEPVYENVGAYSGGFAFALGAEGYVLYDAEQNVVLREADLNGVTLDPWWPSPFSQLSSLMDREVLAKASKALIPAYISTSGAKRYGYVDHAGTFVIPPTFAGASLFSEGMAHVELPPEPRISHGYIDTSGTVVFRLRFEPQSCGAFMGGHAQIQYASGCEFVTPQGRAITTLHKECLDFSEGRAAVQDPASGRWGYVDTGGDLIVPYEFDQAWSFSEGVAAVVRGGAGFYIDAEGRAVIEPAERCLVSPYREGIGACAFSTFPTDRTMIRHLALLDETGATIATRSFPSWFIHYGFASGRARIVVPKL